MLLGIVSHLLSCAPAPAGRFSAVGGFAAGKLWSLGGGERGLEPTPEVWSLDLEGLAWTRHDDAPENVYRATATWDGSTFLVFGGDTGEGLSDHLWRFDPADASWTSLGSGPPPRYKHAAFWMDDQLWIHGGMGDDGLRDDVWRWDGEWHEVAAGPEPLYRQSVTVPAEGPAVVFAGIGDDGRHAKLWTFDGASFAEVAYGDGPGERASHCAWTVDAGVATALGDGDDASLWTWDGTAWAEHAADPEPPVRDAAICAQDGEDLYVLGGDLFAEDLPDFGVDLWRWRDGAWTELLGPKGLPE
ncbi:MAG: Kelch repeat-containing protein [Myxococcota bacterium]